MRARRKGRRRARWRRALARLPLREEQKLHLLTFLVGGLCGLAAVAFHWLLEALQHGLIYRAAGVPGPLRWLLLVAVPVGGGLIAGAGLHFFAPEARGSGIPQVKAAYALGGGRMAARVIPAKLLLPAINIGTGASLGREGPTVQICAAIASVLGRAFALSRERLRSLVPVGAAAGLAAAFNTPIAAVTFTLEEILGDTAARPLGSIVIASVIAAVIERSLLGEHAIFSVPAYRLNGARELPFYLLLGLVAGVVAAAFNVGLLDLRRRFRDQRVVPPWVTPAVGGLLLGLLGGTALYLTGSPSVFGVGYEELARGLQGGLPVGFLLTLAAFKFVATVVSYSSGSSGGIFGPSLYVGGMLGGAFGVFVAFASADPAVHPGAFALVGMGALFAGIVRAPITSIVIIFEVTNNYSIILPLMAANITSYAVARRLSPTPLYDALLAQDGIRLPAHSASRLRQLRAASAMRACPVLRAGASVAEAGMALQEGGTGLRACPVVDADGRFLGMIDLETVRRAEEEGRAGRTLGELDRRSPVAAHPDEALETVLAKLGRHGWSEIAVVSRRDPGRLLGVVGMPDIAASLARATGHAALQG